jgi:hypothetical protein
MPIVVSAMRPATIRPLEITDPTIVEKLGVAHL